MDISSETLRYFVPFSELLASIVGAIYFYKYKHTVLKYLLYLLWYITLTEFIAWFASINDMLGFFNEKGVHYNLWFYNLLRPVTFLTLFFIYLKSLKTKIYQLWIKIFAICYIFILIINWSFIQNFVFEMSESPKIAGSIFLIITVIFYFIELLKSDKIIVFHKTLQFWISVGLLLYYSGTIPFALKWNRFLLPTVHNLFLINTILALAMYLTFTFGFIWSKKE